MRTSRNRIARSDVASLSDASAAECGVVSALVYRAPAWFWLKAMTFERIDNKDYVKYGLLTHCVNRDILISGTALY